MSFVRFGSKAVSRASLLERVSENVEVTRISFLQDGYLAVELKSGQQVWGAQPTADPSRNSRERLVESCLRAAHNGVCCLRNWGTLK